VKIETENRSVYIFFCYAFDVFTINMAEKNALDIKSLRASSSASKKAAAIVAIILFFLLQIPFVSRKNIPRSHKKAGFWFNIWLIW
jgi:hypothetical protein